LSETESAIVIYAHRSWHGVFHRPQQIATRLARTRRVVFVEEQAPRHAHEPPQSGVRVLRLASASGESGFRAEQAHELAAWLAREGIERHVAWLYTPRALELARALQPELLVYDCTSDLACEPTALQVREQELIGCADVVFACGPALYRAKYREHAHVLCVPSSVDTLHFSRAKQLADHCDQVHLARPRMGFIGVLDARLDTALLEHVARARPDWQIVMVGPVVGLDSAALPKCPNLHYAGARAYDELPYFLAGWDVCILPFARNAATRCTSPAKLLEYIAAERPVVSTPLSDVVEHYGDVAYVAESPERFVGACERALRADPAERAVRTARMRRVLTRTSWDATVHTIERELANAAQRRAWRNAPRPLAHRTAGPMRPPKVASAAAPGVASAAAPGVASAAAPGAAAH
jgi:UDP-galactopyranose mutase